MTNSPESPIAASHGNTVELPAFLGGETIQTGARFSLSSGRLEAHAKDVVSRHTQIEGFGRFLVVKDGAVDENIWQQLEQHNVPRLPLLRREENVWVFGVQDGLKPLSHEALFGRESSETYIGDPEIFYEVGRLYKKVHEATGILLLDSSIQDDNPLEHVAISSFSDNGGFLFLHPPYKATASYRNLSSDEAKALFNHSLQVHLVEQVVYQESLRDSAQYLLQRADQGFTEG